KYNRGDIVMVDLGATNYGHEFQYTHPTVVLWSTKYKVYVVPGTSSKKRLDKPESIAKDIIKANILDHNKMYDGFEKPTALLIWDARWVDKKRIVSGVLGKASSRILDLIDAETYKLTAYRRDSAMKEKIK